MNAINIEDNIITNSQQIHNSCIEILKSLSSGRTITREYIALRIKEAPVLPPVDEEEMQYI